MAIDSGSNPLNSTAWVYVEVEDVNDNSPLFVLFNETVSVLENATVGTTVTRVSATDLDSGLFGTVHYHIIQGAAGRFVIDNVTVKSLLLYIEVICRRRSKCLPNNSSIVLYSFLLIFFRFRFVLMIYHDSHSIHTLFRSVNVSIYT